MRSKSKVQPKGQSVKVTDFLLPASIIITREIIISRENTISCMHLCDELAIVGDHSDPIWPQINLCIEFARKTEKSFVEFNAANLKLKVTLRNPSGKSVDITENDVNRLIDDDSWSINRLLLPLTGYLGFKGVGNYHFEVFGKTGDSEYELLLSRLLRVKRVASETETGFQ